MNGEGPVEGAIATPDIVDPGKTPRPLFAFARPGARWPLLVELLLVLVPLAFVLAGLRAP